jgi:hypothetical protein
MGIVKRLKTEFAITKHNSKKFLATIIQTYYLAFPIKNFIFYLTKPVTQTHINDFMHNILPQVKDKDIHDIPQGLLWAFTVFLLLVLPLFWSPCHENMIYSVKNFITVGALTFGVFTLRYFSFFMTIIPDPNYHCISPLKIDKPKTFKGTKRFFYFFL